MRWTADATYVWTERDGLVYVSVVLDCADREGIGRNISQRNDAKEATWALEDALLRRFGTLPQGDADVMGPFKLECVRHHRFQTFEEAKTTIEAWINHYHEGRPPSRLGYLSPSTWRQQQAQITASSVQKTRGHLTKSSRVSVTLRKRSVCASTSPPIEPGVPFVCTLSTRMGSLIKRPNQCLTNANSFWLGEHV